jgi:hypothetical protein
MKILAFKCTHDHMLVALHSTAIMGNGPIGWLRYFRHQFWSTQEHLLSTMDKKIPRTKERTDRQKSDF